ncbi:MAG: toprim domain-containing protein [Sphingobium sp.]
MRELARLARIPTFTPAMVQRSAPDRGAPHLAIWRSAKPVEGTLAERYVRDARGIQATLTDIRFHERCPRGRGALAVFEPALLVGMRRAGEIAAIQRIFLDPRTAAYTAKLTLGSCIGAAWTNGPPATTIGICEGFETAAAYTSLTGIKAWATMGAKRFHQLTIPTSAEAVILLADNDAEGRRAESRAREAYARPGLTILTEWPPGGANDWAQLLKR